MGAGTWGHEDNSGLNPRGSRMSAPAENYHIEPHNNAHEERVMPSTLGQIRRLRLVAVMVGLSCITRAPALLAQVTFTDEAAATGLGYVGVTFAAAWGDYDGDGYVDLYIAQQGTQGTGYLRNQLYHNDGNGTFTDVAPGLGLDLDGDSDRALWADYDNDGYLDLYVARAEAANVLFHNDGGTFTDVAGAVGLQGDPTGRAHGAAWGDYDGDGYLDLFVTRHGAADRLYRGDGTGFVDVTTTAGVGGTATASGRQPAWADYDGDGDIDLFVPNNNEDSRLYRNDAGVFTDEAAALGVTANNQVVGAAWADYDNDGDVDLYITGGNGTNWLYRNDGTAFAEVAVSAGVAGGGAGRGIAWGDYDNDGYVDLATVTSGGPLYLYRNNGDGTFVDVAASVGAGLGGSLGQIAWADYDRDGDLDLYVGRIDVTADSFLVSAGGTNSWLAVALVGSTDNRKGVGAVVAATAGGITQMRVVDGGTGYGSQGSLPVEFGLGAAPAVDTLTVQWPSGATDVRTNVAANQMITVTQGGISTPASILISAPTAGQVLPAGTASTPLTVAVTNHPTPGHWHWQLDTPFPDTGVAGGTHVDPGVLTTTIAPLVDGASHTVYVALVADAAHNLVDATGNANSRASVSLSVDTPATVSITAPTANEAFPAGTVSTPLTVAITGHAAPGHWHWQLDTPFADAGVAGGTHVDPGVLTTTIAPLVDGASHTVYVALIADAAHNLVDATGNAASRDSVAFSVGTVGTPTDAVSVGDAQGSAGDVVAIPVDVYDAKAAGYSVTGIDLTVTYDPTILTPKSDAVGVTAAELTPLTAGWSVAQNVVTPGELEIVMAADFVGELSGGGAILSLGFTVDALAATNTTTPVGLSRALLNEGLVPSTAVAGTFTIVNLKFGDVTGNGTWSGYDASHVLEHVARELADGSHHTFPVETTAPVWAPLPLTHAVAETVANVGGETKPDPLGGPNPVPDITANDASLILQRAVSLITIFPVETAPAPAATPIAAAAPLRASVTSERPGALVTVSLDASAMPDVRAGELVLEFDGMLLRPVDVSLRRDGAADTAQRPLLTHREGDGRLAVAFASARPLEGSDAVLEVTFEATRNVSQPTASAIRASHLRLNRSLIETNFAFAFRVEPFANRLMANYPNPFNPETWIPFELATEADVTVRVYGVVGELVRTLELGRRGVGEYRGREQAAYWDGRNERGEHVASGVYLYELSAGDYRALRRMVVLK